MDKKKTLKVKTTVKQTADKIKNSESTEKALHTINDLTDKTKSSTKDLTEKIKSSEVTEKIINSEAMSKAKSTVNDVADIVANSEKAKELVDSVKSKNIKANKIIKIGAIALIFVIVFGLFTNLFGEEAHATKSYQEYIEYLHDVPEKRNVKVKVECVAKVRAGDRHFYAFRVEVTWEKMMNMVEGIQWEKQSQNRVVEVIYNTKTKKCEDNNNTYFEYTKYNDDSYKLAVKNAKEHFKSYNEIHKHFN